jgi:prepilin-type N-terminal cleavage/methylation domain-containing protein
MRMFRKDEGFTLVELMVVVLIIGILIAIAIPVFQAAQATARQRACFSNQRIIEGAVQQWLANYPDSTFAAESPLTATGQLVPNFVKSLPKCANTATGYSVTAGGVTNCPAGAANTGHGHY